MRRAIWSVMLLVGCGSPAPVIDAGPGVDAGFDAGTVVVSKAAHCASVFGTSLTTAFGRFDGVVTAVVTPADTQCPLPNGDHVVVQVSSEDGGIYRMVVNVQSDFGDPEVRFAAIAAPLRGGFWDAGWHPGLTLDYPSDLQMHPDAGFIPISMGQLILRVADEITVGQRISVFADSSGGTYSDSAHKIHRNGGGHDGALVLNPDAASSRWLLFHFANQTF